MALIRRSLLAGLGVALVAIPTTGAPPMVTELCVLSGDVESSGAGVEIGVKVSSWELLDRDGAKTTLWLRENLLWDEDPDPEGNPVPYLDEGSYYGQARVLKKDGRFDFDFGPASCISPVWGDQPPYWVDGDGLCPYRLVIVDGVYDRGSDTVTWDGGGATVSLVDYTLGVPCEVDSSEGCIPPGGYLVGSGPVSSFGITALFVADGGDDPEPAPEEFRKKECRDGVDNDGDGLVDEADPSCAKWY